MSDIKEKQVLLGLSKEEISSLLPDCPKYTAAQIYSFLQDGKNFDEMTSLKKDLREKLKTTLSQIPSVFWKCLRANPARKNICLNSPTTISSRAFICRTTTAIHCVCQHKSVAEWDVRSVRRRSTDLCAISLPPRCSDK